MAHKPSLEWINERPEGTDDAVIADITKLLASISSPESLSFHTVFLGDDMETSPGVVVTGEAGNPNIFCEYFPKIGDAFETLRPNMDSEVENPTEELTSAISDRASNTAAAPDAVMEVFLRGGKAATTVENHTIGHNPIANRIAEDEQDKGA